MPHRPNARRPVHLRPARPGAPSDAPKRNAHGPGGIWSEMRASAGAVPVEAGTAPDPAPLAPAQLFDLWLGRDRPSMAPRRGHSSNPALSIAAAEALMPRAPDALAVLVAPSGQILAASAEAEARVPGLHQSALDRLPFDAGDTAKLHLALYQALSSPRQEPMFLRARNIRSGLMMLMRVTALDGPPAFPQLGRIEGVDTHWPADLAGRLQSGFGIEPAQETLLRALATGESLAEIAIHQGCEPSAIRTEIAEILRQTGTRDLSELLQLIFGLLETRPRAPLPGDARNGGQAPRIWGVGLRQPRPDDSHLMPAGDRRVEWLEYGAPGGRPVLYLHYSYGMTRWSARAIRAARQRGFRILVPLRPGYGGTSRLAPGTPWRLGVLEDYARLCDHLGLQSLLVVSQGADLRLALALAEMRPDLVRAVLGCAAQLPLTAHSQFELMGKWQRFVLRNARFAPEVLPAVVKSAFAMLHTLGIEDMLRLLNGGSRADLAALDAPEIREALLSGMAHALPSDPELGPAIFTEECLDSAQDWSDLLHGAKVPLRLMQADQDPLSPLQTLQELQAENPSLDIRLLEGTGQFLLYQRWQEVLDAVEELAGKTG